MCVTSHSTNRTFRAGPTGRPRGDVRFALVCCVRYITLLQYVQNRPILDLRMSVHSCIIQGIRKLGKVPKLERLKMKIYQVFENYEDGAIGTFSTIKKAEAFIKKEDAKRLENILKNFGTTEGFNYKINYIEEFEVK